MIKFDYKLAPYNVTETKLGINNGGRVHKYFTKRSADYMDKYVPMDTGALRINKAITTDEVIYQSPYARYIYYGKLYVMENGKGAYYNEKYGFWSKKGATKTETSTLLNYKTPGTGSRWEKKMWTAEGNDLIKEIEEYQRRGK